MPPRRQAASAAVQPVHSADPPPASPPRQHYWNSRGGLQLLALLAYFLLLHAVGVAVFTRGFLLTRVELPHVSKCSDLAG